MIVRQRAGSVSLIGPRSVNEDSLHLDDQSRAAGKARAFLAVADGMGGLSSGDVASRTAIQVMTAAGVEHLRAEDLIARVASANAAINEIAAGHDGATMGTTLTSAVVIDDQATVAHIGDSRAYVVHTGVISLITEDHSQVGRMVRDGVITELEAMHHPQQNVLERALGAGDGTPDIYRVGIGPGDILFLCTDGLHTYVTAEEICLELEHNVSLQAACERLARLADERGSDDNITAVAWEYPSPSRPTEPSSVPRAPTVTRSRAGAHAPGPEPTRSLPRRLPLPLLALGAVGVYVTGFVIGLMLSAVWA